eukprot:7063351-Ditylum_brightwellii.AAC.1
MTAETLLENLFADNINPGTKIGLALFNAPTLAVSNNKHIDLSTKNSQKSLDLLEDLNVIVLDGPSEGASAPTTQDILK